MISGSQRRALLALFATGLGFSILMMLRSQLEGDGISLLSRGWLLAAKGIWVQLGNPAASAAGGYVPGGLTSLVVGLPLELWMDPRAPVVLILVCHVVAYLMLDRVVGEALGMRARIVFAVVFWLNPWRVHNSGWVDNSNYLFLTGALHLWACYRQRESPSFLHSALLVAGVGLTFQLHLAAMTLVLGAVLLWLRGLWRPHWGGVALGAVVTFGALVPFFLEAMREPRLLPGSEGYMGRNLVHVLPPLKGVLYWFRYASLDASSSMLKFDFTPDFGATVDAFLTPFFSVFRRLLSVTVVASIAANVWQWRERRAAGAPARGSALGPAVWLREYAVWTFLATFAGNALSPSTVMWWHNLVTFHATLIPLLLCAEALAETPWATWLRRGVVAWAVLSMVLLAGMSFGSRQYRNGGRKPAVYVLESDHEMVRDLGLLEGFGISVDEEEGAWPRKNSFFYVHYVRPYQIPPPKPGKRVPEIRWE